jgi:hypothetical protein
MNLFFLHSLTKKQKDETVKNSPVLLHEPLEYTSEGSEFLNDAIRTKDQPLIYTEESLAVGYPEHILLPSTHHLAMNNTIEPIARENQLTSMHNIIHPDSLDEKVTDLKKRGYQLKFRREETCLNCMEINLLITPDSFTVDECYHFEDGLNTDRERTLYAVSSIDGRKGFVVDTCFVYEDNISPEMEQKLKWE